MVERQPLVVVSRSHRMRRLCIRALTTCGYLICWPNTFTRSGYDSTVFGGAPQYMLLCTNCVTAHPRQMPPYTAPLGALMLGQCRFAHATCARRYRPQLTLPLPPLPAQSTQLSRQTPPRHVRRRIRRRRIAEYDTQVPPAEEEGLHRPPAIWPRRRRLRALGERRHQLGRANRRGPMSPLPSLAFADACAADAPLVACSRALSLSCGHRSLPTSGLPLGLSAKPTSITLPPT